MGKKLRVIRVLQYEYDDAEYMIADMHRWQQKFRGGRMTMESTHFMPEFPLPEDGE
jgi:hypothetical protein